MLQPTASQSAPATHASESSERGKQAKRPSVGTQPLPPDHSSKRLFRLLPAQSTKLQDQAIKDRLRRLLNEVTELESDLKRVKTIALPASSQIVSSASCLQDFQLLSHYHHVTYESFSNDDLLHDTWRYTVPGLAFGNVSLLRVVEITTQDILDRSQAALMHGLLAVTALHFAHFQTEKRDVWSVVAASHQSKALSSFTSRARDVTADNYHAYIITASFIFIADIYMIVDSHRNGDLITVKDIVQSFRLIRGM